MLSAIERPRNSRSPRQSVAVDRSQGVESLRAVAMTMVVAFHVGILPFGWVGVWLFFVISGYVVTLSILKRPARERGWETLRGFILRRFFRIVPAYFLYVGLGIIIAALIGAQQSGATIASMLLFYDNIALIGGYGEMPAWPSGHLWTLSTEMQFYLIYGSLLCCVRWRTVLSILVIMVFVAPLLRAGVAMWLANRGWLPLDAAFADYAGPLLHFDAFAFGALLAFIQGLGQSERFAGPTRYVAPACLVAYCIAYLLVNHLILHEDGVQALRNIVSGILIGQYREVFLYTALDIFFAGLLFYVAIKGELLARLTSSQRLAAIGKISYGCYLFHPLAVVAAYFIIPEATARATNWVLVVRATRFLVAYCGTLLLGRLSFYLIERPAMTFGNRWQARRVAQRRQPVPPAAMPCTNRV